MVLNATALSGVDLNSILGGIPIWLFVIVAIWSLIWKGIALWKAARLDNKIWFVILLVANTVGILDILYVYVFSEMINYKSEEEKRIENKEDIKEKDKKRVIKKRKR